MRVAVVGASKLSPAKGLRARDYVANPRRLAQDAVAQWIKEFPVVSTSTTGGKRLVAIIEKAIREGMNKE